MKKLYSFILAAIAMLGISFSASAGVSTTLTWDDPGSVKIRVGGMYEPFVDIPADATSYTINYDKSYGSAYVYAADGYVLLDAVCENDGATINPKTNNGVTYLNVDMGTSFHNTHTVHVNVRKLVFDASVSVDVEGVTYDLVSATVGNRQISLNTGKNTIEYDSEIEKTIKFNISTNRAEDLSIKEDGVELPWEDFFGSFRMDARPLVDGTKYVIHYNNQTPVEKTKYTVALNYANDMAKDAVEMISTKAPGELSKSVYFNTSGDPAPESVEVEEGSEVHISFNTKDYTMTVNGSTLSPDGDATLWSSAAITANGTINISAAEREWGTTYLSIGIVDPEGVVLNAGSMDGPIIDLTALTSTTENIYDTTFKVYSVPVSLKSPKVFVNAAPGWYITQAGYNNPNSTSTTNGFYETSCALDSEPGTLHVWTHKINKDTRLVVFMKGDLAAARLRDQHGPFPLADGYSEFMIDPVYSGAFSVQPINVNEDQPFSVYLDYNACAIDENGVYSDIQVTKPSVIQIFSLIPESKKHTYTIENKALTAPEITYDYVLHPDEGSKTFTVYVGSQVSITPAAGYDLIIDDEVMPLDENGTYTFIQGTTGAFTSHDILITNPTLMYTDPADGDVVDDLEYITITFPNATTVTYNADEANDEVTLTRGQEWANNGWDINAISANKFRFTPKSNVYAGNLTLTIHADFFTIDGEFGNKEAIVNFTNNKTITDWQASPENTVINAEWGPQVAFVYEDGTSLKKVDMSGITVTYQGNALTANDYMYDIEGSMLMFGLDKKYAGTEGELRITVPAGALQVNGKASKTMEYTWNVVLPKEYTMNVTPQFELNGLTPTDEIKFTIEFPEAETAEVWNPNFLQLGEDNYNSARYFHSSPSITEVEGAEYPTLVATFPAVGKEMKAADFKLWIKDGAFTLDGAQESPEFEQLYTLTIANNNVMGYTLTPADGDTVESIEAITIAFPNATEVTFGAEDGMSSEIAMHNGGWSYYTEYFTVEQVADAAVPTFTLTPDKAATANGEYTFSIAAGQFMVNGQENEEINATYTVYKEITADDLTYTITPEAGSNIDSQNALDITVAFAAGLEIDGNSANPDKFSLKLNGTELEMGTDYMPEVFQNNLFISVMKSTLENKAGKLTLDLAAGWAKIADIDAPAISAEWTIVKPKTDPIVVTPEFELDGGLNPNDDIKFLIEFPQATKAVIWSMDKIKLEYGFYDYMGSIQSLTEVENASYPTFEVIFSPAKKEYKNAAFEFELAPGAFLLDGKDNPEYYTTFTMTITNTSGINAIFGDGVDSFTVVTVDGRVILVNADAEAIKQLAAGLYIINGKKVYLTK